MSNKSKRRMAKRTSEDKEKYKKITGITKPQWRPANTTGQSNETLEHSNRKNVTNPYAKWKDRGIRRPLFDYRGRPLQHT